MSRQRKLNLVFLMWTVMGLVSCTENVGQNLYLYDMGTENSAVEKGYIQVTPVSTYTEKDGYGWLNKPAGAFDTLAGKWNNGLNRDGVWAKDSLVFKANIPNGVYLLTLTLGDNTEKQLNQSVYFNGALIAGSVITPWYRIPFKSVNKKITISNGVAVVKISSASLAAVQNIEFRPITRQKISTLTGFEPDTVAVKHLRGDFAVKYLKASYYYDLGAWSKSAKTSGINFTFRMYLAADMLEQIAAFENDPLYDKAIYLLAKIHYWLDQEDNDPYHEAEARKYFTILKKKYPDAELIKMYLGEQIPFEVADHVDGKGAPQWAVKQHEAMQRMLKIIYWWVNERQEANGELGGKYGDDVEILRWWLPAILGADDATAKRGYMRLADGVWNSGIMERGFAKKIDDVEHAAELFRDTHPSMFMIRYGDPEYIERCLISMQNFEKVWTGITPKGHRHFKSCYLSATAVLEQAPMNVDVPLNARAVLPGLWAAWYNRNPTLIKLFSEWGNAWVADAARTDGGKPAGVLPAAIAFADDGIGAHTGKWYDPGLEYDYYKWESLGHVNEMQAQLIGMYGITSNTAFLKPVNSCYDLMIGAAQEKLPENPEQGSLNWVKKVLLQGGVDKGGADNPMTDVFAMAGRISNSSKYDEFIALHGNPYNKYLVNKDPETINKGFEELLNSLRYNFPLLTTEVKYTDRVYVRGSELLFGMYTGHFGSGYEYPSTVATWKNTGPDMGVFVRHGDATSATVSLYNFGETRTVTMQTWLLEPGTYKLSSGTDTNDDGEIDADQLERILVLKERVNQVQLQVPAGKLQAVRIEQLKAYPKIEAAADVALSDRDISIANDQLSVKIHNVGNVTAKNIRVELWAGSRKIGLSKIAEIPAPNDLVPRWKKISFKINTGMAISAISVRVFTDHPEITTLNNTASYRLTP
ncbi:tetratricopeptide repeat protein [Pedobacter hiemivivus]|uniref:CARDB domain-containing protein n=1 Tax=Pedobacter hiemivivus TaxID=2530454 RepID=A0A4R0N8Y8_9SPHI|nr:hypothetical protein [Pedobacter hiemivivus]TCC96621.1 hypothetical protein EZ444_11665 [Pedobacter hiemivivus]